MTENTFTNMFQFQTGSIKSSIACGCVGARFSFNSKLVRLKVTIYQQHGRCRSSFNSVRLKGDLLITKQLMLRFNSKLVRLKGFAKAIHILYAPLMVRVNLIFSIVIFKVALLSTYGCAHSLGDRLRLTGRAFRQRFPEKKRGHPPSKTCISPRSTADM